MTILPSTYLPSISYFRAIVAGDYVIDLGEHFIKRSERNRAQIMTANGVMQLTVNVVRANRPRTPMREIEIDYSKRWQHQHWTAILSAYKSSPFFDYYADMLEPLFRADYNSLVELNLALTSKILTLMGLPSTLNISHDYITASDADIDLRPKKQTINSEQKSYIQVFSDRHPFAENLSIIDLLFCEGPNAVGYLL
ncbi:MAG: WbqC family protein [Rikenellaceae bacterium]